MGWDDGAREGWGWGWGWGWAGRGSFGSGERVWRAGRGRKRRESQRRGGTDGRMDGVGRWLRAASVEEEEEEVVEEARLWCWCWCWLPGADSAVVVRCCKEDAGNVGDWAVWMHAGGGGGGWVDRIGTAGAGSRASSDGRSDAGDWRRWGGGWRPRGGMAHTRRGRAGRHARARRRRWWRRRRRRSAPRRCRCEAAHSAGARHGRATLVAEPSCPPPLASGDGSEHPSLPSSLPPHRSRRASTCR